MEAPNYILTNGTKVQIDATIGAPSGMLVKQHHLDARRVGASEHGKE